MTGVTDGAEGKVATGARAERRATRTERVAAAAAGALVGAALAMRRGDGALASSGAVAFAAALAVATIVDARERRVPNALTYGGTLIALVAALAARGAGGLALALGGALLAGGVVGVVWLAGRGRLGLGDAKFAAFAGAALGPAGVPTFLLVGAVLGGLAAALLLAAGRSRTSTIAYAPYLAAGAAIALAQSGLVLR